MLSLRPYLAASVLLALFSPAVGAEYRLDSGDQLEVLVPGLEDFQYRAPVDLNGEVSLPLLGSIKVRGLTLAEVRTQIGASLPNKVLFRRTDDGRKAAITFNPEELSINIVEYRPVYVSGDVMKSGSVPFRPGLTLRQALAAAGGLMAASASGISPMELMRVQGDRETLTLDYAKAVARVWRLGAELKMMDAPQPPDLLVDKETADRILNLELDQKKARQTSLDNDKAHIRASIAQVSRKIASLEAQSDKESKINEDDQQDLSRLNTSLEKGNTSIFQVSEARRAALTSATRVLQTKVLLEDSRKEREDLNRRLVKLDEDRRVEILSDMQTANVNLLTAASRLRVIGLRVSLPNGSPGVGTAQSLTVFRKTGDKEEQLIGRPEMELMPGDVISVGEASGSLAALEK